MHSLLNRTIGEKNRGGGVIIENPKLILSGVYGNLKNSASSSLIRLLGLPKQLTLKSFSVCVRASLHIEMLQGCLSLYGGSLQSLFSFQKGINFYEN